MSVRLTGVRGAVLVGFGAVKDKSFRKTRSEKKILVN